MKVFLIILILIDEIFNLSLDSLCFILEGKCVFNGDETEFIKLLIQYFNLNKMNYNLNDLKAVISDIIYHINKFDQTLIPKLSSEEKVIYNELSQIEQLEMEDDNEIKVTYITLPKNVDRNILDIILKYYSFENWDEINVKSIFLYIICIYR